MVDKQHSVSYSVLEDYFVFDENDIELHQMKKYFNGFSDKKLHKINVNFDDFLLLIQKHDFTRTSFPYLKSLMMPYMETLFHKFDDENSNLYFLFKVLSNIPDFKFQIKQFYGGIIKNNYFGISPQISTAFTKEVFSSSEYLKFVDKLADWYTRIEIIIFYLSILTQMFRIYLTFDEKKFSLEQNVDFSIKTFAKKNFLKLASYVFKQVSFDVHPGSINYKKVFLLLISSFTCGISLKDFIFTDIKHVAFLVSRLV